MGQRHNLENKDESIHWHQTTKERMAKAGMSFESSKKFTQLFL